MRIYLYLLVSPLSLGAALSWDSLIISSSLPLLLHELSVLWFVSKHKRIFFLHCLRLLLLGVGVNRSQWYLRSPCEENCTIDKGKPEEYIGLHCSKSISHHPPPISLASHHLASESTATHPGFPLSLASGSSLEKSREDCLSSWIVSP